MKNPHYKGVPKVDWKTGKTTYRAVYYPRKGRRGFTVKDPDGTAISFASHDAAEEAAKSFWEAAQKEMQEGVFTGGDGR